MKLQHKLQNVSFFDGNSIFNLHVPKNGVDSRHTRNFCFPYFILYMISFLTSKFLAQHYESGQLFFAEVLVLISVSFYGSTSRSTTHTSLRVMYALTYRISPGNPTRTRITDMATLSQSSL